MAEASPAGKRLKDLKVVDLKAELEKRGLATSGVKVILADRLSKYLEEEEKVDPNEFVFGAEEQQTKDQEEPAADAAEADEVAQEEQTAEGTAPEEPATEDPASEEPAPENPSPEEPSAEEVAEEKPIGQDDPEVKAEDEPVVQESEQDPVDEPVGGEEKGDAQDKTEQDQVAADAEAPQDEAASEEKTSQDGGEKKETTLPTENGTAPDNTSQQEEDSINLMLNDDDVNFDEDDTEKNQANATSSNSPPRPENAPVVTPFTSNDTIQMASSNKPHSENSSMLVNPDESESVGSNEKEQKEEQNAEQNGGEKAEGEKAGSESAGSSGGRSLWVSGLPSSVRAADLQTHFSKAGKVTGAKIVTNSRTPGAKCFGIVTMSTKEEADKVLKEMAKTVIAEREVTVELHKADSGPGSRRGDGERSRSENRRSSEGGGRNRISADRGSFQPRGNDRGQRYNNAPRGMHSRNREVSPRRPDQSRPGVLTFEQIREQRERNKAREEERRRRERQELEQRREKRRREEEREAERKRRYDEEKIRRERDELRREREKLEREKAELLKFERERQKMERERLQKEKEELEALRRQHHSRMEDTRRGLKRSHDDGRDGRGAGGSGGGSSRDAYYADRKREASSSGRR